MFKLFSQTGPAAFESIGRANTANDYAFVSFTPDSSLTFNEINELSTDYAFTLGDCHGGSLRWSVRTSASQALFIYYGDAPNFTDCTTNSQSGTNIIGQSDLRYDTSQYPGGTLRHVCPCPRPDGLGADHSCLARARLLLGRRSAGHDQQHDRERRRVRLQHRRLRNLRTPCDLPDATIEVSKTDPTANGEINEATVQNSLTDSGNHFRVVDCKYQYVLSIPSLKGAGTYRVTINDADGHSIPTPDSNDNKVKFDLK